MSKYDKLKQKNTVQRAAEKPKLDLAVRASEEMAKDARRTAEVYRNAGEILDDIDARFEKATGLNGTDVAFLMLATALQVARQYVLSNEKFRLDANQGDKLMENVTPPQWHEILLDSVPYDATRKGIHVDKTGLSGTTHRYRTLGHDPVLGWIFGTANIMTRSLTKSEIPFETYQVKNMEIIRHYPNGVGGMLEKACEYSLNDPKLLAVSVARQAIHFGSDYFTKQGLPIPLVSTLNNDLAKELMTKFHIDVYGIVRGMALATFVNHLISIMHQLLYTGTTETDRRLYEVRTRKILSISNLIASTSNVIVVAANVIWGDKSMVSKLDVGGIIVTLHRLISDTQFIRQVKSEFLEKEWQNAVLGDEYSFLEEAKKYEP